MCCTTAARRSSAAASCEPRWWQRPVELWPARAAPRRRASTSAAHAATQSTPPAPGARRAAAAPVQTGVPAGGPADFDTASGAASTTAAPGREPIEVELPTPFYIGYCPCSDFSPPEGSSPRRPRSLDTPTDPALCGRTRCRRRGGCFRARWQQDQPLSCVPGCRRSLP